MKDTVVSLDGFLKRGFQAALVMPANDQDVLQKSSLFYIRGKDRFHGGEPHRFKKDGSWIIRVHRLSVSTRTRSIPHTLRRSLDILLAEQRAFRTDPACKISPSGVVA